eukprot:627563-Prymnesium_polylepis.2
MVDSKTATSDSFLASRLDSSGVCVEAVDTFDLALFGSNHPFIKRALATQPTDDGGLGHVNVIARYRAEWVDLIFDTCRAPSRGDAYKAWHLLWWSELDA